MIKNQAPEITELPVWVTPLDLEIAHVLAIIMGLSCTF